MKCLNNMRDTIVQLSNRNYISVDALLIVKTNPSQPLFKPFQLPIFEEQIHVKVGLSVPDSPPDGLYHEVHIGSLQPGEYEEIVKESLIIISYH